jgi:hypothetical protein
MDSIGVLFCPLLHFKSIIYQLRGGKKMWRFMNFVCAMCSVSFLLVVHDMCSNCVMVGV